MVCVCLCAYIITQLLKGLLPPAVRRMMTAVHGPTFMLSDPSNYLVYLTPTPQTQHHYCGTLARLAVTTAMMSKPGNLYVTTCNLFDRLNFVVLNVVFFIVITSNEG